MGASSVQASTPEAVENKSIIARIPARQSLLTGLAASLCLCIGFAPFLLFRQKQSLTEMVGLLIQI
jgi:hypothetical protein